jgi:hypothetical protein
MTRYDSGAQLMSGVRPIRALACPCTPGLAVARLHQARSARQDIHWMSCFPGLAQSSVQPRLSCATIPDTGTTCRLVLKVQGSARRQGHGLCAASRAHTRARIALQTCARPNWIVASSNFECINDSPLRKQVHVKNHPRPDQRLRQDRHC